jgi:hypothetical protein
MSDSGHLTRVIQACNARIFNRKHIQSKDTILIVGSPRSGTTWVMNILSALPEYTYLFEPLNPLWFPESFKVGFRSRTHIPSDFHWPEGEQYLTRIFEGKHAQLPIIDNPLSDLFHGFSFRTLFDYLFHEKLIVKSVNMNRMLPWVAQRFHLRGIVCIVRHPCAVVASQLKTGLCGYHSVTPPYVDVFPTSDTLINEVNELEGLSNSIRTMVNSISTREEVLAATWCLDNYTLLSQTKSSSWDIVIYENLFQKKEELERLFSFFREKNVPREAFHRYKQPSVVTTAESKRVLKRPDQHLSQWKQYLSEKQIERILRIVSAFDIRLYSHDVEPHDEALRT